MSVLTSDVLLSSADNSMVAVLPNAQLLDFSLGIKTSAEKAFVSWTPKDHSSSFRLMQSITLAWKNSLTTQYLLYGKVNGANPFSWEIVPYQACRTCFGRIIQQLRVLWRTVFGGVALEGARKSNQQAFYKECLQHSSGDDQRKHAVEKSSVENKSKADDAFCNKAIIERQCVITGTKVNVLFNHAPIGFGGERLHFLIVPKEHRETFTDLTEEEYLESMKLTAQLQKKLSQSSKELLNAYLFLKTGIDAGQTVKHVHLHAIFTLNNKQDFWSKLTVVKNILFGSSPMNATDLTNRVADLKTELSGLRA